MIFEHTHSVKEITMARECLRKWAAKYLHRLTDPKGFQAQDGIDMHELLRAMCGPAGPAANTQPESKIGRWARALYPLTPPGVLCELEQTFDYRGHRASFRIDFTCRDPQTGDFCAFGDWKSCAGPKWALTPDTLRTDLQANLEAYGFMVTFGRTEVPIRWLYVDKKTDRAWHVDARMTLAQTDSYLQEHALPWMRLVERMRQLHAAGQTPPLASVPHDPIACDGVGRMCAFLGACQMRTVPNAPTITQIRLWADQPEDQ
jgi:hypothetical protein